LPLPVSCRPLECRRREHCPNRPPSVTSHAYSSLPLVSTPVSSPHPHLPLPPPRNAGWQAGSTGSHGYERVELLFGSKPISSHEHKVLVFGSKPISLPYGEEGSDKCYYKASSSTRRMFQNLILYFACDNDVYSPLTIICLRACKKCFVARVASCVGNRAAPRTLAAATLSTASSRHAAARVGCRKPAWPPGKVAAWPSLFSPAARGGRGRLAPSELLPSAPVCLRRRRKGPPDPASPRPDLVAARRRRAIPW